ncbi:MAG: hypothetical protein NPIRA05_05900 [Nitrospirales bacterium]|nr:MAG: hypothetical protein NPIRA05_05900 [Nitrospirales bacterium]GJL70110.1 MAG: hypothetical protein NPIRA06_27450 [Nitrospirales bacterium]
MFFNKYRSLSLGGVIRFFLSIYLLGTSFSPDAYAQHPFSPLEDLLNKKIEDQTDFKMSGHEKMGGPMMIADRSEHTHPVHEAQACPNDAPVKFYDVIAMQVTMVLNRWGDRDPNAYMYALRDTIPAIRQQESAATDSHFGENFGLNPGLGNDPIQPLTIRANVGDCVQVTFTNLTHDPEPSKGHPASFHVHGADFILTDSGKPALSTDPDSIALPGDAIHLEWYVNPDFYQENTHYLHSHGPKMRWLVSHGLMGALIVEQAGSEYFNAQDGSPLCTTQPDHTATCQSSWNAMISPGDDNSDFREFTMVYHEIGNEQYLPLNKDGDTRNLFIDPLTGSYKPNGRAINYRSESFLRRLGEAEVMAKVLNLNPGSEVDHTPDSPAYLHNTEVAKEIWDKINQGFIGDLKHVADESQAYGTYAFGDPATPIPRSYVGDPTKFRVVHGGSETFHVPHLHGGGIQWQRQPGVGNTTDNPDYTPIDAGLKKHFTSRMPSSGNDAQTIGPSETYELEIGCGSGGCQQAVGDFLFHCHVASHYISGMWHFWRVYNTLQDNTDEATQDYDVNKTDELGRLAELPDRKGQKLPAVTSEHLIGKTVDFAGQTIPVTHSNLKDVVEVQFPPQGRPKTMQDATVFDWKRQGHLYLNEPETKHVWPNFASPNPGERIAIRFEPQTGKLAYPMLRPHLGRRPPFAPHHGPAPFLEPLGHDRSEPASPGVNGPSSLCPTNAPSRRYKIHAIQTPIQVTDDETDNKGMLFVVKDNEDLARSNPEYKVPLAIRANQGDCVDLILVNELEETGEAAELSKTNIHQHFLAFDVQASDGVISGASFEQSPRPIHDAGMSFALVQDIEQGATHLQINDTSSFHPGTVVAIGIDQSTDVFETAVINTINTNGNILQFTKPIKHAHQKGERVSVEFVRYRWYAERQTGASYFHDHVDALQRWGHGLFGAIIAEPRGSTYHHPNSGEETLSGPIMDIHVNADQEVVPGLKGSFREFVAFSTDRTQSAGDPTSQAGRKQKNTGSINLRAEPLKPGTDRGDGPPHLGLSSVTYGDPITPMYQAYTGDPIIFRLLTTATEEIHPFHITGHHFRWERFQENSPPLTVYGVGISERFNAYIEAAGGAARKPGDYLYYNGTQRHFRNGAWGILRVFNTLQSELQPLPGREPLNGIGFPNLGNVSKGDSPPSALDPGNPCPANASEKHFDISAIDKQFLLSNPATTSSEFDQHGRMYVLDSDVEAVLSGEMQANPLVIRANIGDCITVKLTNRMKTHHASFHLDSPTFDPQGSLGITLGLNPAQTVPPHDESEHPPSSRTYRYFAEEELGAVLIRDFGDPLTNGAKGLYGALIVEPQGSTYVDPITGEPLASGVTAVIQNPDLPDYREFALVYHDADPDIGTFVMPYDEEIDQMTLVNYRAEPLKKRLNQFGIVLDSDRFKNSEDMNTARAVFSNHNPFEDPTTNVFETFAGDPVRFRIISGYSEQPQMFSLEAHEWELMPQIPGSDRVSSRYLPSSGVLNIEIPSAGGPSHHTGDYMWSNHRQTHQKIGQWGLLRVLHPGDQTHLKPLANSKP